MLMEAPFIDKVYIVGDVVISPRTNCVCVGSTYQYGQVETQVSPVDAEKLRHQSITLLPALKEAKFLSSGVGIRPARIGGARLEVEMLKVGSNFQKIAKTLPIIHNYGHGPRGIAQHWGCALEVAGLASQVLSSTSKL